MALKSELTRKESDRKLKDFDKNKENPFIEKAIESIKIIKKTQVVRSRDKSEISLIVNDEGEVEGHSQFLRFIEVDEEKFAKIYLSQFAAFWELPQTAIKVFGYIMTKMVPNRDKFEFYVEECIEYTKYKSKTQIYEGLVALCINGIIARAQSENLYFINPMIVFNGNRVTFAKTYIKKKTIGQITNPRQITIFDDTEGESLRSRLNKKLNA